MQLSPNLASLWPSSSLLLQGQTDDLEPLRALARALHADDYLTAIDLVLTSKSAVLAAYLNVVNVEKWRYKAALQLYESLDSSDHRPMELGIAARRLGFGCIESLPPIAALPEQVRCQQPVTRRALVSWVSVEINQGSVDINHHVLIHSAGCSCNVYDAN